MTGRSHKKQKDVHLTLTTLTEAYDTVLLLRACFRSSEIRILNSNGALARIIPFNETDEYYDSKLTLFG